MGFDAALKAHLQTGTTTTCRCWSVTRRDGAVYGFTDHDMTLRFGDISYRADTGMTATALEQSTGLSVDNSEAMGVLNATSISEADIFAGRLDGAEVVAWLVNWADVAQRVILYRGTIGEITRADRGFRAELRGLTEALNQEQGRVYQAPCGAILGDGACGVDLSQPGYSVELAVETLRDGKFFEFSGIEGFEARWFERGRFVVLGGAAAGLFGVIKNDRTSGGLRRIELWEALKAVVAQGDLVRLEAGCDKRVETCRLKFDNMLNFRGFPDIPGEDWQMSYPQSAKMNDGGSLR
ncbi:hypothetical protein AQS8620_01896 [Aquimixticola soesokkakensis]|uniref:Bacteriophage phiJL001 Gp84 C-terminal domain-containing protein n=1 Tax=Aquimixticola soesokkakensis TaxID=1519096 RepID=A0A1Y5SQN1_9RHOB|nr:DUF2163 domain-containing protein [Aquimixticola soesokkakensis]SLN46055.1 hypothetical protein AQS8620_01896 [Aquimixticola soesokkakensis]